MAFNPDEYLAKKTGQFKQETDFNPDDYLQKKLAQEEEPNAVEDLFNKIDSYTGAPVRKAVGTLQEGKGIGSAISAGLSQFGEDTKGVPSAKGIVVKAGVPDEKRIAPRMGFSMAKGLPPDEPLPSAFVEAPSMADFASFPADMVMDVTNLPLIAPAKALGKGVQATVKGIQQISKPIAKVEEGIAKAGKFGVNTVLGVPKESIDYYLKNLERLGVKVDSKAMTQELAGELDSAIEPFRKQFDLAQKSLARAKELKSENVSSLTLKVQDAKEALRLAEDRALGEAAARVSARVQDLNKATAEGSQKAFSILDDEGVRVSVTPIKSDLTRGINLMEQTALTDQQIAVVDLLKRYRERLDKLGKDISGGEAKRIIQAIDREVKFLAPNEVARLSQDDQVLGILRRRFDQPLKKASPNYESQMKQVAGDTRLLMNVSDYASPDSAYRALKAAQSASGSEKLKAIQALEQRFGEGFLDTVVRSNLPEFKQLIGQIQKLRSARKGLGVKAAQAEIDAIDESLGVPLNVGKQGIAGIEDRIRSYVSATNPRAVSSEALMQTGQKTGINMDERLKDIKTIASFEKGYNRGSANTNMWGALLGGVAGTVLGPVGTLAGAATGGVFGRSIIDNFGPAIGRKILDQVPNLQKMKPSKWIQSLDVPKSVKMKLEDDLFLYEAQQKARMASQSAKLGREKDKK